MKKILLFVFVSILSISAFAADLNPFAYKLSKPVYDAGANSVTISYHLNAPATKVRIVIYQDEAHPVTHQDFTGSSYTSAGAHTAIVSLHGVPGGFYTYKIDVYGKGQSSTTAFHKRTILNSPMSVDIDNNMNSPYFGRTLVTQPTKNDLRGIYEYWPSYFTNKTSPTRYYCDANFYYQGSQSWYYYAHATPLRVRVAQDGTGRVFTTACDVDKNTYLWYVDPANLDNWSSVLTASEMKEIVNHPSNLYVHNISLDIRVTNDNKLDLLLLSGSVEKESEFITGYIYSGIYTLPADFPRTSPASKKSAYTSIVNPNYPEGGLIEPHHVIKSALLPLVVNSSSQFDKYGGVWFCGTTEATTVDPNGGGKLKDKSALVHIKFDPNKEIKDSYLTQDPKLTRYYTNSGGFRYNRNFSQVLVGYGELYNTNGSYKTARLYNVTQQSASVHPSLEYVADLGVINDASETNHVVDFAWDHANNIYVILRNGNASVCGIYTYATKYDSNTPFVTKAPNGVTFEVECYDNVTYTLTTSVNDANMGTISTGGEKKSCTEVTVTANPKEGYRFVNWTINGVEVNGANPYTLYMTDNMDVRANFTSAVFNVTWWNLFQGGEDIGQAEDCTCGSYTACNERLWRLFQVDYNNYLKNNSWGTQVDPKGVGSKLSVLGFFAAGNNTSTSSSIKDADFLRQKLDAYFKDNSKLFYWLGQYIQNTPTKKTIDIYASYNGGKLYETFDMWGWFLQAFINRQDKLDYQSLTGTPLSSVAGHPAKQFSIYGQPSQWRPYWTDATCGLSMTMNYSDAMPITWKQNASPSGTIKPYGTSITHNPSSWYKWNTPPDGEKFGESAYLLAWREGSTNGRIVHQVDRDMALYATYMNKHISESKNNDDVIRLMQNSKYASNPHTVTVDRKLQAGMYNTICFPFPLNVTTLPTGHRLKDAEVLKFTGIEELYDESGEEVGVLQFERVTQLEAGKPYLIKVNGQDNITEEMRFEKVAHNNLTYVGGTQSAELSGGGGLITFQAMISPDDIPEGSVILVSDNRLAKVTTQGQMLGLRGYFTIDDPYVQSLADEGKLYLSIKKPTTTSIPVAPEAEQQKAPKVHKIMQDGHIYIIRGEEVYTVTGHRVK